MCADCELMHPEKERPAACPECRSVELKEIGIKEDMVRVAEQQDCQVEVVNESEALSDLGGIGCLLRYRLPDEYA